MLYLVLLCLAPYLIYDQSFFIKACDYWNMFDEFKLKIILLMTNYATYGMIKINWSR